ncbi:hypothetical protein K1516_11530 [Stenotrophomonas maltophilia]|uniref:hypothetical protein n=1 Tax=Stenotrophomonas maltophilia TaxID=40324 RepID=UPI00201090F3|nr:hypothetical protein [Stenotrophomonas maltophilia]UQA68590.1 hypothetical protein K1516_11530 [Stenotrophomonas maltophilia]
MRPEQWRVSALAVLLAGFAACTTSDVGAAEVLVTAEFMPSALDPSRSVFRNTTPPGVYCSWRPEFCTSDGAYTVDVPLAWSKLYLRDGEVRQKFYLALPGPRTITLTNKTNGLMTDVRLSIETISGQLTPGDVRNPVFTASVGGGCQYVRTVAAGTYVRFGWRVRNPEAPAPCHSRGDGAAPDPFVVGMSWFGLGLRIVSESPLSLVDGMYEGETTFSAGGAGSDIDFGDDVTTEPITLKFRFTVRHDFQVRFPDEIPSVTLTPEGGWSQWVDHGRPPRLLRQELPFHLTTSMDFSMKLRCEYDLREGCGIRNAAADVVVPVDVDVTIPGMSNVRDGRPTQNTALLPDDARAPRFAPDGYLMRRRSALRFTAGREAVTEMLKSPGSHWQGNMTVVFDADP